MAKVVITVDTEAKSLAVTIDGSPIANAKSASAYQYRDSNGNPNGIDVAVNVTEQMNNDVRKETSYYAMGSAQAEKIIQSGQVVYNKDIPNFVGITAESKVQADIAEFLATKLGNS